MFSWKNVSKILDITFNDTLECLFCCESWIKKLTASIMLAAWIFIPIFVVVIVVVVVGFRWDRSRRSGDGNDVGEERRRGQRGVAHIILKFNWVSIPRDRRPEANLTRRGPRGTRGYAVLHPPAYASLARLRRSAFHRLPVDYPRVSLDASSSQEHSSQTNPDDRALTDDSEDRSSQTVGNWNCRCPRGTRIRVIIYNYDEATIRSCYGERSTYNWK